MSDKCHHLLTSVIRAVNDKQEVQNKLFSGESGWGRRGGVVASRHGSFDIKHLGALSQSLTANKKCRTHGSRPTFPGRKRCRTWSCLNSQTGRGTS